MKLNVLFHIHVGLWKWHLCSYHGVQIARIGCFIKCYSMHGRFLSHMKSHEGWRGTFGRNIVRPDWERKTSNISTQSARSQEARQHTRIPNRQDLTQDLIVPMLEDQERHTEEEDVIPELLWQRKVHSIEGLVFARRDVATVDGFSESNRRFWKYWEHLAVFR